jgi:hypothetical protein
MSKLTTKSIDSGVYEVYQDGVLLGTVEKSWKLWYACPTGGRCLETTTRQQALLLMDGGQLETQANALHEARRQRGR